jgi:hypothetical protein
LQPGGWNVGFDDFYSMLFTGPSGLPNLIVTLVLVKVSQGSSWGPETGRFDVREVVA